MRKLPPASPPSFDASTPPSLSSSVPTVSKPPVVSMVTSTGGMACQAGGEALLNAERLVA